MRNFLSGIWRGITFPFRAIYNAAPEFFNRTGWVITFPFRLVFNILAFPFRKIRQFNTFLNTEPGETQLTESFVSLVNDPNARESFWDHIEQLRMHLLRAVGFLMLTVVISFAFTQQIIEILAQPIGGLDKLTAIEVTESISVFMKVALFSGVALAIPYIAFELWWFAAPGLRPRERKMGLAGIPLASIFFIGGAAFTFFLMLPAALPFLSDFLGIKTELRPQSYFTFVTGLMFWIGLSFEFPLVIYVLTAIGLIQPKILAQQWRLAIVIIAIAAAAITPTIDPVNQGLVMAPMILLYFMSIGLSYIAYAGRKKSQLKEEADAGKAEAG